MVVTFLGYSLVEIDAECTGADDRKGKTDNTKQCAEACAGAADMIAYDRSSEDCYCQYLTKNGRCKKQKFSSGWSLYSIESMGK